MARELPLGERTIRRLRVYGGRALRGATGHKCLFLHLPKCGGTSVAEALYATVPLWARITVLDAEATRRAAAILHSGVDDPLLGHEDLERGAETFRLREEIMLTQMAWGSPLIHGHVLWSEAMERHFGQSYRIVTLMRDPVERMISNYRMARTRGIAPADFGAYLESPLARAHALVFLRYLSGVAHPAEADVPDLLALALARLARFDVIGFLDDLPGFAALYERRIGVRPRIGHYNVGQGSAAVPDAAQMRHIQALCAPDLQIYAQARGLTRTAAA